MQLMMLYPEIDALAPIQSSRHLSTTLFTVRRGGRQRAGDPAHRSSRATPRRWRPRISA
jgi:hypothetical protein